MKTNNKYPIKAILHTVVLDHKLSVQGTIDPIPGVTFDYKGCSKNIIFTAPNVTSWVGPVQRTGQKTITATCQPGATNENTLIDHPDNGNAAIPVYRTGTSFTWYNDGGDVMAAGGFKKAKGVDYTYKY